MDDHFVITSDIDIAGVPFRLQYQYGKETNNLILIWSRKETDILKLTGLDSALKKTPIGFSVPEQVGDLDLALSSVCVKYDFEQKTFAFSLKAEQYGCLTILCDRQNGNVIYSFILQMQSKFLLSSLPVFGSGFSQEDYVALREFKVNMELTGKEQKKLSSQIRLLWRLLNKEVSLSIPEDPAVSGLIFGEGNKGQVKYLDVNKDFGPFRLSRVGFEMEDSSVTLYVDAGIRLSVVLLELIGLYFSIPFSLNKRVDYGLKGAAVSFSKAPLEISGGLTLDDSGEWKLYTGEISVRFKDIGVTALCSYGQFAQGDASLFAFFMVSAGLGGPPAFFITGLAGGFGFNRSISLPDKVKDVENFSFVAAAMGKGNLKEGMTPAEALTRLNRVVTPAEGQYFFSAGVRFQSFGLLESFLLCNVEFGERSLVSILGMSRLAMPFSDPNPLVYIRLALKTVIAPDEGEIRMEGALMDGSYVFDKNCRVNGGFACCVWFGKSEYAGDFVITLGGYRNGYQVAHYPRADRLSINWKMDSHLTLSAEAYFALTPACVMLGGNLALVYENGRVKAWFKAWAEFFMRWEPFCYDISVGISIGASYRWDFFPFYKTFKVELGANLALWGPPFGGKVHISWFIISFTISFGKGKPTETNLEWMEFADTFLPERMKQSENHSDIQESAEKSVITIRAAAGVLRSGEKTGVYLLNADAMELEITSQMMATELFFQDTKIADYQSALGIVPMGVEKLCSRLTVQLTDAQGKPVTTMQAQPVYTNAPKALWNAAQPVKEDTDNLLHQVPFGIRIVSKESSPNGVLPREGSYDMEILCANEKLGPCEFSWETPDIISGKNYPKTDVLRQVEESIGVTGGSRKEMLEVLSSVFGVWTENELLLDNWEKGLERQLNAEPILAVIGADV